MTLKDLFDDPVKQRAAEQADRQLNLRLNAIEGEIGDLKSEIAATKKRNDELEILAKLAVGVLGEVIATHGQLPPRTEVKVAHRLLGAIRSAQVEMDSTLRQNLEVLASRQIR